MSKLSSVLRFQLSAFSFQLLFLLPSLHAQEAIRMSQAGSAAAEARSEAARKLGYYNLKLGPTLWNFSAGLGLEANDNIRLGGKDSQMDLIFQPEIKTRMRWPISELNSLNLALGAGYYAYVQHPEFNHPFITPGTELSFDIYIGDFRINLHDRASITARNYTDPTITGIGDYETLENAMGVGAVWDLNKVIVKAGYDHLNYMSLGSALRVPDGTSESFYSSAGYTLKQEMQVGLDVGATLINYSGTTGASGSRAATQWSVGPFFEARLSEFMRFRSKLGYTGYTPESSGVPQNNDSFTGLYFQTDINHLVNQYLSYSLSGGRSIALAYNSGVVDLYFARWQANWRLFQKNRIGTSFVYERGSYLLAGAETFNRYGPGVSLSRDITKKLIGSLGYQYYLRGSDLPGRDYAVNILTLNLTYNF